MKDFECLCKGERKLSQTESRIAEILGIEPEWLHDFMDNWEVAFDTAFAEDV